MKIKKTIICLLLIIFIMQFAIVSNATDETEKIILNDIKNNTENNNEENLTVLCPNCHSLTSTYKGANINFGRKARSKYK